MKYCSKCGSAITDDSVKFCPNCGASVEVQPAPAPAPAPAPTPAPVYANQNANGRVCPETHLTKAILFTIFFCLPFGIPAIVNAAGVSEAFNSGNYQLAEQKSRDAAKWCKVSLILGIIAYALVILYIVVVVLIIGAATSAASSLMF